MNKDGTLERIARSLLKMRKLKSMKIAKKMQIRN
jgi:hypothetical protein